MIFSTDTILQSRSQSLNLRKNDIFFEDKSFFLESLDYILADNIRVQSMLNMNVVNEGFIKDKIKQIDPIKVIKRIIDLFIQTINNIWESFKTWLLKFSTGSNKDLIKSNRAKLENIKNSIYYYDKRCIYSNLGINTSYSTFKSTIQKEFNNIIKDLEDIKKNTSYDTMVANIEQMKNIISNSTEYLDELRGTILEFNRPVTESEFAGELHRYFRSNGEYNTDQNVQPSEIKLRCVEYFNFDKSIKSVDRDKSEMQKYAKKIQDDIGSIKLENCINGKVPENIQAMFVNILNSKIHRVKSVCNIYIQLFSAKLDAIKEQYLENTKILTKACKDIVKEGSEDMINMEYYEFNYNLFLAENELFETMVGYGADVVNESVGLIGIHESVKDTIMKYLRKVADSIQKAWEKFKEIINNAKTGLHIKTIIKQIEDGKGNADFTINNYKDYDIAALSNIKIQELKYEEMKQYLGKKDDFISKYYSDLSGSKDMAEAISKKVIKSVKDTRCSVELVNKLKALTTDTIPKMVDQISEDLNKYNTSSKNIETIVNNIGSSQVVNDAVMMYEMYLAEEGENVNTKPVTTNTPTTVNNSTSNNDTKKDNGKVSFKDDEGRDKKTSDNSKQITVEVTTFVTVTTQILSAKMKIARDMREQAISILDHYVGAGKDKKERKEESDTQVKIDNKKEETK